MIAPLIHFFFVGLGRVSTTVVEGRLRASLTGMYRPVRASRPILLEFGFFAMMYFPIFFRSEAARQVSWKINVWAASIILPHHQ